MWGTIIGAAVAAIGSVVTGLIQHNSNKKTNQSNAENVANTNTTNQTLQDNANATNKEIQDSINKSNEKMNNKTNKQNYLMNKQNNMANLEQVKLTNKTNQEINEATNAANAQNVAATNEANLQIAQDTNLANEQIYKGVNDTNIAINNATNDTNKAIAQQNLAFQRENLDYQKALQQDLFNREDTAYQRTAYDMAKAGLNPLTMSGTNGAGSVVSTSALNNDYQAQSTQVQGYNAVGATMNAYQAQPYQAIAAQMQSAHATPYEKKAVQQLAAKMEKFQAQLYSFDFLSTAFGHIEDGINNALTHGIQRDQLNEIKKNNSVDRITKLAGLPYTFNEKTGKPESWNYISGDEVYNLDRLKSAKLEHEIRGYEHDNQYGLFNSSTDWERQITGIQYLIDTNRLQSVGNSLKNGLFDIFNDFRKMYNRSF